MEDKVLKGKRDTHVNEMPISLLLMGIMLVFIGFTGSYKNTFLIIGIIGVVLLIAGVVVIKYIGHAEVTIEEDRIYGKAQFDREVDLKIEDVDSATLAPFDALVVNSKGNKYKFVGLSNSRKLYEAVNQLKK